MIKYVKLNKTERGASEYMMYITLNCIKLKSFGVNLIVCGEYKKITGGSNSVFVR